ncbi:hypothetical protein MSPP1_001788 [Malassezia sp. CBS 17886]|nr:hypothetical protein MSPP1_001788 [Malassezia sp. CBS 17886]
MFKRLTKAKALQERHEGEDPVALDVALADESDSEEESSGDEDEEESDAEQDRHVADEDDESAVDEEDGAADAAVSVTEAISDPIYVDQSDEAGAPELFRCVACPAATLKTEKSAEVHLASKGHKRRQTRFIAFVEAEASREGEHVLHLDPRTLVDLLDDERSEKARAEEKARAAQKGPKRKERQSWG